MDHPKGSSMLIKRPAQRKDMYDNKTGKQLNTWEDSIQHPFTVIKSDAFLNQIRAFEITKKIHLEFVKQYPKQKPNTLAHLDNIVLWLLLNPDQVLQISSKVGDYPAIKRLTERLEGLKLVEVRLGFPSNKKAMPRAIKATEALINYELDTEQ